MSLHEQSVGATDEWYTPKRVFDALGCRFDMDVSAPHDRRFVCTPTSRWISVDSLDHDWDGFIWMNAPFGGRNALRPWLGKFFKHRNGIALVPDRTSAPWWQEFAPLADAILFIAPKLKFIGTDGKPGLSPAQGTSLFASGDLGIAALHRAAENDLGILVCPVAPADKGQP